MYVYVYCTVLCGCGCMYFICTVQEHVCIKSKVRKRLKHFAILYRKVLYIYRYLYIQLLKIEAGLDGSIYQRWQQVGSMA